MPLCFLATHSVGQSPVEKRASADCVPLFDGKTTSGWTSYRKTTFPARGWKVEDGWLLCEGKGGDIVSVGEFAEFELEWEWKLPPGGNSGVKYFVLDRRNSAIGHEFQLIDDTLVEGRPKQMTGAFYDVVPPRQAAPRPPGEINHSRVVVRGDRAEHWLNGVKVVEYQFGSPDLRAAVAKSKFKNAPGFGEKVSGRILLQDHGSKAWFRNMKIRRFK